MGRFSPYFQLFDKRRRAWEKGAGIIREDEDGWP